MTVVTRFAPSPTGYLHIGGARTALFNWLFAKKHGGQYLLRIEDTDRARSTDAAIAAIFDGLNWLGLKADGEPTFQFARAGRHREVAEAMIARGTAFRCYMTPKEIEFFRGNLDEKRPRLKRLRERLATGHQLTWDDLDDLKWDELELSWDKIGDPNTGLELVTSILNRGFRSIYRDGRKPKSADAPYVIRLRAPNTHVVNNDLVQGEVRISGFEIDDLILLRADGNPTYMLSVVVDDHDMGVTHVIRGDDHLTNAARQIVIYQAMGWDLPLFAHIPLIHGPDGAKLSKRHGAPEVQAYRDLGYLPEAMCAYLMRLGWSPGHDDIISKEEAIAQFDLAQVGKAPSRLDFDKLNSVNAHFLKLADDQRLGDLLLAHISAQKQWTLSDDARARVQKSVSVLKNRAKTLAEMAEQARFLIVERPLALDTKGQALVADAKERLQRLRNRLISESEWENSALSSTLKAFVTEEGVGMGQVGPPLRAALTGGAPSPDIGQTLELLGRDEALARLADQI